MKIITFDVEKDNIETISLDADVIYLKNIPDEVDLKRLFNIKKRIRKASVKEIKVDENKYKYILERIFKEWKVT